MSHSTRFIMIALVGWVGVRALSLGMIPGGEAFAFDRPAPKTDASASPASHLPPVVATEFPPLEPVAPPPAYAAAYPPFPGYVAYPPAYPSSYARPYPVAYGVPMADGAPVAYAPGVSRGAARMRYASSTPLTDRWGPPEVQEYSLAPAAARYADAGTPLDQWPIAAIASGRSSPERRRPRSTAAELIRTIPGFDRLSMSGWAMMRREPGTPSLASNGQLGGSQAGARVLWRYNRALALSIRSSAPVGGVQRSAEFAGGVRWQPSPAIPIALTAERRQSFGPDKGSPAFAFFAEGGVYDRPIAARFNLDAYFQAGVVGVRDHAAFIDGSATLTRPVWSQLSAGFGLWGGAQPGLARLDLGPRLSWRIGSKMRVHADYRQRMAGHASPGSGPVLTLAANF